MLVQNCTNPRKSAQTESELLNESYIFYPISKFKYFMCTCRFVRSILSVSQFVSLSLAKHYTPSLIVHILYPTGGKIKMSHEMNLING